MNSDSPFARSQAEKNSCCDIDVHIQNTGDVHIYNCSPPASTEPCVEPSPPLCPPEEVFGSCIPAVAGAKHKLGRDFKIKQLAETVRVPSAIASSTMHMARRFLRGKTPANAIEAKAFPLLNRISREIVPCTVAAFDAISADQRSRLFVDSLQLDPTRQSTSRPLSPHWPRR
jgi:hypothetical protein